MQNASILAGRHEFPVVTHLMWAARDLDTVAPGLSRGPVAFRFWSDFNPRVRCAYPGYKGSPAPSSRDVSPLNLHSRSRGLPGYRTDWRCRELVEL